ncbi:Crp/Fnr family transcriptional regulator [Aquimarina rhabdastrellae]
MNSFINYVKHYIALSQEAEQALIALIKEEQFDKGDQILEIGKTCKRLYYITSGTMRTFYYKNGKDITNWIYPEHTMVTSWHSYILRKPSSEYLEVIEDQTNVLSLTYDQWQELYQEYPELERFGRIILEEQMALIDDYYKGYYFMTAKEKYDLLLEFFPDVTLRANLGHIASMLGMSQETLSRIRGK